MRRTLFWLVLPLLSACSSPMSPWSETVQGEFSRARARHAAKTLEEYYRYTGDLITKTGAVHAGWANGVSGNTRSRMHYLRMKMDVHAVNLANALTPGYRAQVIQDGAVGATMLSSTCHGALRKTDRSLDLAIDGDGYFRVALPDGSIAYTRYGSLKLDGDGSLITSEGNLLYPTITIPADIAEVLIDNSGHVQGYKPSDSWLLQQLGRIELARFVDPSALLQMDDNIHLFISTLSSGDVVEGGPGENGFGTMRQGYIEESNVDIDYEILELRRTMQLHRILQGVSLKPDKDAIAFLIHSLSHPDSDVGDAAHRDLRSVIGRDFGRGEGAIMKWEEWLRSFYQVWLQRWKI